MSTNIKKHKIKSFKKHFNINIAMNMNIYTKKQSIN